MKNDNFLINRFLGIPSKAILSEEGSIKIGKTLSIYGVVSFLFNIIIFAFISLLLINNNNALYIVLFGFIANMVLPLPFLYYIKRHNYDEITNKFEIKNKIPWGTGIIITIVYYVLSVVFMPNIPKQGLYSETEHRTVKYLNNLIEQDHRPVKRRNKLYQSLRTASTTIKGIEALRGIYKKNRRNGTLFGFSVSTEIKVLMGIPA